MLQITIPENKTEYWDEENNQFVYQINSKEQTLTLEHSLVSISKWESRWCKPFLSSTKLKTDEETIDYIRCMTLTQNVNPEIYNHITDENIAQVKQYIDRPMTAVKTEENSKKTTDQEAITSELIYYWMIKIGIPFECRKWHLNRLLALIRVCNSKEAKNANKSKNKKMSKYAIAKRYSEINAARRKQLNSKG
jgi:hypothetical protein